MPIDRISGRLVAFVAGAFLVVVVVHLLWQQTEVQEKPEKQTPSYSEMQIEKQETQVKLAAKSDHQHKMSDPDRREQRVQELTTMLRYGSEDERRTAALRLAHKPDRNAREALLEGLSDPSPKVAQQCAEGLIELWRDTDSPTAGKLFRRGLEFYRIGELDRALKMLQKTATLDNSMPDLYRMRAEIWLMKARPDRALSACEKALALAPSHFRAYYVKARSYLDKGEKEKALEAVEKALKIYDYFDEARALRSRVGNRETS